MALPVDVLGDDEWGELEAVMRMAESRPAADRGVLAILMS